MTLRKFLKVMDPMVRCKIWTSDQAEDETTPEFEGWLMDIPYFYAEYKIGRVKGSSCEEDPPIFYVDDLDKQGHPGLVINLIAK